MQKKYRVEISATAERDIDAIYDFIATDKRVAAGKWFKQLESFLKSLEIFPERHEIIPEATELGVRYRHFIFGAYRAIYRIQDDRVLVLRVVHGSRLLDSRLLFE